MVEQIIAVAAGALVFIGWSKYQAAQKAGTATTLADLGISMPTVVLLVVAAFGIYFAANQQKEIRPNNNGTGILAGVFNTNDDMDDAARDATAFAKLCNGIAQDLEDDSKLAVPFYKFGIQYDDLRRRARTYMFNGRSLAQKYPALIAALDKSAKDKLSDSGDKLTNEMKVQYIDWFRLIGAAAAEEAGKL